MLKIEKYILSIIILLFLFSCNETEKKIKSDNINIEKQDESKQKEKMNVHEFFREKGNMNFSSIKIEQASFTHDKLYVFKAYPISNLFLFVLMDTNFTVIDSKEYSNMTGEGYEEKVNGKILPNGNIILNFKSYNILENGEHAHEVNEVSGLLPSDTGFIVFQPKINKADIEQIINTIEYYLKKVNTEIESRKLTKFVYDEIYPDRHYEKYTGKSLFARVDDISGNDSVKYVNSFYLLGDKIFYVYETRFNIKNGEIAEKFIENRHYYYYDNLVKSMAGKEKKEIEEDELQIIEEEFKEYNNEIINFTELYKK